MNAATKKPLPPLERSVRVSWPVDRAFRRFTEEIGSWWPLRTHSVGQGNAETVVMEGRVGGRILERIRGGGEAHWGTVTAWEPPSRVAFTWHPGQTPESAGAIEVRFRAEGDGTRLELTHSGWEKFGTMAAKARRGYGVGWRYVLDHWADRRASFLVRFIDGSMWLLAPLQSRMARKTKAAMEAAAREGASMR
jgi:uncharacterized protein YndB with AHSA1/START domain